MKKRLLGLVLVCGLGFAAIGSAQTICGQPQSYNLIAGQKHDAGDIVIGNDALYIYVTFFAQDGWLITETHVSAGLNLRDISFGIPGRMPYKGVHNGVTTVSYAIPKTAFRGSTCGIIAAHAVVKKTNGNKTQEETAWGEGTKLGRNWAMYMGYCIKDCEAEPEG
ncbi:MAG TPA: hypothetical protein PKC67_11275 [Kiritimatiellia bacterium]|nr:hypothetical protein [Kiritimatiellia bacterium]HMP34920.1 hypothetical protein [Kiritimatiellia bacterium]